MAGVRWLAQTYEATDSSLASRALIEVMSGHTMYGLLAEKAVKSRGLPVASIIAKHRASFLCGGYLGCDTQVMPEAVCVDTGREVGFGTVPLEKSPITGGAVRPWLLVHDGQMYRPKQIHKVFYGSVHLVFGWTKEDMLLRMSWDHLARRMRPRWSAQSSVRCVAGSWFCLL
jgi:hypothetical protein